MGFSKDTVLELRFPKYDSILARDVYWWDTTATATSLGAYAPILMLIPIAIFDMSEIGIFFLSRRWGGLEIQYAYMGYRAELVEWGEVKHMREGVKFYGRILGKVILRL